MKTIRLLLIFSAALTSNLVFATDHYYKKVSIVQLNAQNGCVYFQLEGVLQADSTMEGGWFAINADNTYKKDALSLLMMAYASKATVKVSTTGSKACGYAQISTLRLQ